MIAYIWETQAPNMNKSYSIHHTMSLRDPGVSFEKTCIRKSYIFSRYFCVEKATFCGNFHTYHDSQKRGKDALKWIPKSR